MLLSRGKKERQTVNIPFLQTVHSFHIIKKQVAYPTLKSQEKSMPSAWKMIDGIREGAENAGKSIKESFQDMSTTFLEATGEPVRTLDATKQAQPQNDQKPPAPLTLDGP